MFTIPFYRENVLTASLSDASTLAKTRAVCISCFVATICVWLAEDVLTMMMMAHKDLIWHDANLF